ncbi:MAG TPA: hypothetical protein VFZ53_20550 [Polyangiaceae bacterium]
MEARRSADVFENNLEKLGSRPCTSHTLHDLLLENPIRARYVR